MFYINIRKDMTMPMKDLGRCQHIARKVVIRNAVRVSEQLLGAGDKDAISVSACFDNLGNVIVAVY